MNLSERETFRSWAPTAITVLVAVAISALLGVGLFKHWVSQHPIPKFGYANLSSIVEAREKLMVERLSRSGLSEENRKAELDDVQAFATRLGKAVQELPAQCGCIVLSHGAFVGGSGVEDLTDRLRVSLAADK